MKKQIFYLKDEPEYFNADFDNEVISWSFTYDGIKCFSKALHELIEFNYYEN